MLKSFVNTSYLEGFYPDILNYKRGGQNDFEPQISRALELVLEDLLQRGVDPRLVMVPLDLNRGESETDNLQQLKSKSISSDDVGYAWQGKTQRRFVVSGTPSGDAVFTFSLEGSNKKERPEESDATWETVSEILSSDEVKNSAFLSMYRWYRVNTTLTSGTGSVDFTASIYETVFDRLIAYRALELIAMGWKTGLNEKWDQIKEDMKSEYNAGMESVKFSYDSDEDGVPEDGEVSRASVRFTR